MTHILYKIFDSIRNYIASKMQNVFVFLSNFSNWRCDDKTQLLNLFNKKEINKNADNKRRPDTESL